MDTHIKVSLQEVRRVFDFLEKANKLMHQPMAFKDPQQVEKFVDDNYREVWDLYYHVVWNWLPDEVQKEIEER
jgi:hypothetical protein